MRKLTVFEIGLLRHLVTGEDTQMDTMSVDWEVVLASARSHRLDPLLHLGAKRSAVPVPERVRGRLERVFHMELARNVVRLHHVEELDRLAMRSGRAISLLKGAAFVTALYESPGARAMADVDVLVRHDDFAHWTSEVEGLGFRAHESSDHAVCFRHARTGVFLELHRDLTSEARFLGLDASLLLDRASKAPGYLALATLSPEDHLLHLCLHASFQHGFRQPAINAWDARLLLQGAAFDPTIFIGRARAPRLLPWVFGGLKLSQLAFPDPLLDALVDELAPLAPQRLRRKLATLGPADVFTRQANGANRPPIRRLLWIGDGATAWTLLFEVLRPRAYEKSSHLGSTRRALQLIWNHYLRVIPLALMKQAKTLRRHTPASLGEVRDV